MNNLSNKILANLKFFIKILIVWVGEIIVFYLLADLGIGLTIDSLITAIFVIIILEIINSIFWPSLTKIFLPFLVYTIGIGSLLLNGGIIWVMSLFIPTLNIEGYALIIVPLGIAVVHTILTTLLTLGNEEEYYNFIIKRKKIRYNDNYFKNGEVDYIKNYDNYDNYDNNEDNEENNEDNYNNEENSNSDKIYKGKNNRESSESISNRIKKVSEDNSIKSFPGIVIIEIDGLAKEILEEAIQKGHMPTLAKWLKEKTHGIKEWETDLSSQTGSSQAGILHGNNKDIVAFRWVEKENNNKIMVSTGLLDAPKIEERISNGKGLLHKNGSSRSNLFSGDTENVLFTYSKMHDIRKFYNKTWYFVYSNPSNFGRILLLCGADIVKEIISQINHKIKNIQPRIRKNFIYLFVRACANVYIREINTQTIIGDMIKGEADTIYSTYLGYDEIAHHSGIRDKDSFNALKGIDRQIKRIYGANNYSKRQYNIVIQSDHGQSNGSTFKQRYDLSLKDLVHNLLPEDMKIYDELSSNEDHFSQVITLPIKDVKNLVKNKTYNAKNKYDEISTKIKSKGDNVLEYITNYKISKTKTTKKSKIGQRDAEVIVLASGNLGLIYLIQWETRLNYETIKELFPELIPGLVQHEGIGFILVNSSEHGALAIGEKGVYYLDENKVEGKNPLEDFGPNARKHLLRTNKFEYVPDILVNSVYDKHNDEVAAFEELVGSHGGLGGTQNKPFIMYPSDWKIKDEKIVGAENIHRILKENLNN
ncbi:phage holin family protein [Methanobrevibacter arboriphilus]|uniref:phage holin family protein n=2 Tax=Methanobrevibacter arboriphilus TaxID=39441 RepID=UPI00241CBC18|nr:phage holin family protein [Methanobrevibacter arboriphilus]